MLCGKSRQCAVGSGQWQWAMGNGQWVMGNGQWAMGNGQWAMGENPELIKVLTFCAASCG
jgi:hypothetical protein